MLADPMAHALLVSIMYADYLTADQKMSIVEDALKQSPKYKQTGDIEFEKIAIFNVIEEIESER